MKPGRLLALLLLTLLLGGSGFALPAPARANSLFAQVTSDPLQAQAGATQTLAVLLHKPAGRETIFRLAITYPSGATQQVVDATVGREATLEWEIPLDAGVGEAHFELIAMDCGCGDRTLARPVNTTMEKTTGVFVVE